MDFTPILKSAGIPTTQVELETVWRNTVEATGSQINNDNRMSPFWRVLTACVTNPALWLINFVATTVMPNAYVKYATGDFLDLLADSVNLTRKGASYTVGNVAFRRNSINVAVTIPVNTLIQTAPINGVIYQLKTTQAKSFSAGSLTVDVPVIATVAGTSHNLAANYFSVLPTPILGIASVANGLDWITTPGANKESDADLRARIRNQFGTASDFHTDSVYKALIAQFQGVHIDAIWIEHNAPRGAGTANAYVLFDFSAPVSLYLAQINDFIMNQGHHGHGDDVLILQMPEHNLSLTATVWVESFVSNTDKATLRANVMSFINAAFRENSAYNPTLTLPYSRFSFSKLAEELHNQFSTIHSIDFNQSDIVSGLWIPRLTPLTVTVLTTE